MFAGRDASEGIVGRRLAEDGFDSSAVSLEGGMESRGGVQDEGGAPPDTRLLVGGEFAESRVFDEEGRDGAQRARRR